MRSWQTVAVAGLFCFVLAACYDGANFVNTGGEAIVEPPGAVDMSGRWSLTSNPVDPPIVFECTGDLPPDDFTFCDAFAVTIVQEGDSFDSSSDDDPARFCDSFFDMTGFATFQEIFGIIHRERIRLAPPVEAQFLEFQAGIIGDSATFALVRLTVQDAEGECLLGGSYIGARTISP